MKTESPKCICPTQRPRRLLLFGLCSFLALTAGGLEGAGVPAEAAAAASKGLPVFLAKVPVASKDLYGFPADSDLAQARLGEPLLLHAIRSTNLPTNPANATVSSVMRDTSLWFFPVLLGSETRAMLVVDRQGGEWKAVSFGYAPLAREWDQVSKQWPAAKGFHPQLIAVFRAARHYFTVPEIDDRNLTLIASPQSSSGAAARSPSLLVGSGSYAALGSFSVEVEKLKSVLAAAGFRSGR
ncbi:MAG: hypothetical protein NT154_30325 [Verrucomicrobia bacterium]|nr:hypothetical protein [Verrucomicrobiota bacterium]